MAKSSKRKRDKTKLNYTNTKKFIDGFDSGGYQPTTLKLPAGMSLYKWKKGRNKLDFMPFTVGKNNPNADEDTVHWERTYHVHDIPTADGNKKYCCLAKNFKKKCPICIELGKMRRNPKADQDALKKMDPKVRRLFFVQDRLEKDKGIQVLETGHFKTFGEMLSDVLETVDDESPVLDFWHLEDGMACVVNTKEDSFNGRAFNRPTVIAFEPRKTQYDSEMIDEIPCLDDMLKELSYKELDKIFGQTGEEDEEEDEDEDTDDEEEQDEEDEEESDDEEDEAPKRKKRTKPLKPKKKKKPDPEDEEEDDDSEGEDGEDEEEESEEEDDGDEGEKEEEDDEDEGDEEEQDEVNFKVGDKVWYKHHKTKKKVVGKVKKLNKTNRIALLDVKGEERPPAVDFEDLHLFKKEADDEDDEEEKPAKKKKGKKKVEDDEEDEIAFDDDDDQEDEDDDDVPVKKRRR